MTSRLVSEDVMIFLDSKPKTTWYLFKDPYFNKACSFLLLFYFLLVFKNKNELV